MLNNYLERVRKEPYLLVVFLHYVFLLSNWISRFDSLSVKLALILADDDNMPHTQYYPDAGTGIPYICIHCSHNGRLRVLQDF